ncbi:MAG TPA: carbohydrate ABC transporter permease [Candidatus Eisenbergiella pullistercoris]|uniref:Carbohydrate ABC transporter permease n=1 Tax=Candidatus Eisenbergiella pullistercoris TaxID=2838555 RepID=A0A9D1YPS6_9FIRM|nr:carbohydrate ABC transporter permease [Candidatus Eisenbergiella pullistercoris]
MKGIHSDKAFTVINYTLLVIITLIILYPLYFTVIASISEPYDVVSGNVVLWPKGFTLDSYRQIFQNEEIWVGFRNSVAYTVFGTLMSLVLTIPAAYALSKKNLWGRGLITTYFVIIMYFSGGLLPTYLVVRDLGLLNQPYTLIIIGSFSVYNMVVARTYYQSSIPESLYEAAEIDGCSGFGQFFRIAVPLSKPIIAVIALYYAVGRWNDFYNSLVYITNSDYYSLQQVLRNILLESQNALAAIDGNTMSSEEMVYFMRRAYMAEAMKYAIIFVSSLPMLLIYPLVQKHFVKGVMIGSVKG